MSVRFSHALRDSPRRRSVHLSRLAIRHFRNLGTQDLVIPPEGVALVGDNAQGKSNFLEAIYYLETFRSFRGARDEQLVAFGADVFRLTGTTNGVGDHDSGTGEVTAAYQREGKRKKVSCNGTEPERIGDALGGLSAVIFSPADVELVSGGPSERRRFLDIVLSLNQPGYLEAIQEYRGVLARRNAALKEGHSGAAVGAWNPALIRSGSEVMRARSDWVTGRCQAFGDYYVNVSADARATMSYRPSVAIPDGSSLERIADAFTEALVDSSAREVRRGVTLVGPHRDDVSLRLDGDDELDLRDFGSGGQRRTAALALRLVEAATIRQSRGCRPLVLLDDVFAELDEGRGERVLDLMEGEDIGQVVLTAPKDADVRIRRDTLARWRIRRGRIET